MMRSTLGAPLGGTMRGGHQGVESFALSLITPPNFGGGGGSCLPSMVVVALGEPNCPVTCCAVQGRAAHHTTNPARIILDPGKFRFSKATVEAFMGSSSGSLAVPVELLQFLSSRARRRFPSDRRPTPLQR